VSRAVFIDTSAWWATSEPREPRHRDAVRAYQRLLEQRAQIVTTNLVLAEMHALMARRRDPAAATEFLDLVHSDPTHDVRYVDRELEAAAADRWLRVYRDQRFSLTDACSFEVMRREGIRSALALDRHFTAAGFDLLL
jgi:hypothetical protein